MIGLSTCLRPNQDDVASKVMDGEAIIINLSNGIYYSMDKVGGLVWELIEKESSSEKIVTTLTASYDVERTQAQADVERLVAELFEEKLIVELGSLEEEDPL